MVTDKFACSIAILCMKQWHAVVFPFTLTSLVYAGSLVYKCVLLSSSWNGDESEGIPLNCLHIVLHKIYSVVISVASNIAAWRNLVVVSSIFLLSECWVFNLDIVVMPHIRLTLVAVRVWLLIFWHSVMPHFENLKHMDNLNVVFGHHEAHHISMSGDFKEIDFHPCIRTLFYLWHSIWMRNCTLKFYNTTVS